MRIAINCNPCAFCPQHVYPALPFLRVLSRKSTTNLNAGASQFANRTPFMQIVQWHAKKFFVSIKTQYTHLCTHFSFSMFHVPRILLTSVTHQTKLLRVHHECLYINSSSQSGYQRDSGSCDTAD